MRRLTYEITFVGQASSTLRAELLDQAALSGLVLRVTSLGLEVMDVHSVTPLAEG